MKKGGGSMSDFGANALNGFIWGGIPTGILCAVAWLVLKGNPIKAVGSFFACCLMGCALGLLGAVPLAIFLCWRAMRGSHWQRAVQADESRMNAAGTAPAGFAEDLAKIHSLFKSGALTEEEYNTEKKKLLNKAS